VLEKVKQMDGQVDRLTVILADGGFDGAPFLQWVMDTCRWILQVVLRPKARKGFGPQDETLGGRWRSLP
jgi:transposase